MPRYVFYFMFTLTFKAFVMLLTLLLFQSNLFVFLAHGKGLKNSVHRDLFRAKNAEQKTPLIPSCVLCALHSVRG